jgi:hypothetical protein
MDHSNSNSIDSLTMETIKQIEDLNINNNQNANNNLNNHSNIPSYKRMKLIKLKPEEEKGIYSTDKIQKVYDKIFSNYSEINYYISHDKLEYFYYNCEDIKDYGYGCAWRCIQTILGTLKNIIGSESKFISDNKSLQLNSNKIKSFVNKFENIFLAYGHRETLDKLFLSCYSHEEIPNYLKQKEYAPFETQWGWAQPFISKLILHDFGITGDLYLLNGYNVNSYAPAEVFQKTIDFESFKNMLFEHFRMDHKLPVIIDDSLITLCILGIYSTKDVINSTTTLLIADPHVKIEGSGDDGIYHIVLDKNGNFVKNLNTHPNLNGKRLMFEKVTWMVYFPRLV